MLNFEKYKDEIENYDFTKYEELDCYLCKLRKGNCYDCNDNCSKCIQETLKFLFSEYKEPIKLTLHEKCILESIDKKYKYIARNEKNELFIYLEKPHKHSKIWISNAWDNYFGPFNHLFKFIKWQDEEPRNIQELLENCEVINDE